MPLYFWQERQVDMNETTQQAIVQTLREKILSGELEPGRRLVEAQAAELLGVSRTPLRYALSVLSSEGLLERSGARGYVVRRFSVRDVLDAIDVRGALEGLAARCVAERRVDSKTGQRRIAARLGPVEKHERNREDDRHGNQQDAALAQIADHAPECEH